MLAWNKLAGAARNQIAWKKPSSQLAEQVPMNEAVAKPPIHLMTSSCLSEQHETKQWLPVWLTAVKRLNVKQKHGRKAGVQLACSCASIVFSLPKS